MPSNASPTRDNGKAENRNPEECEAVSTVWLINPYGPIPGEAWREYRFTTFGRILARAGCRITWWTSAFSHHFKRYRAQGWRSVEVEPNFTIALVPTTPYKRHIGAGRPISEAVIAWRLYHRALSEPRPDCIITADSPPLISYTAARLAEHYGCPLIVDVADLWPELFALVLPKPLRRFEHLAFAPLYAIRRRARMRANGFTALCRAYLNSAFADPGGREFPTRLIFNGIDVAAFRAAQSREAASRELHLPVKDPDEVWVAYAGTLGDNYDLRTLLAAASILRRGASKVRVWIAGNGCLKGFLEGEIERRGLDTVHYLGVVNPYVLAGLYACCDIGLCPYSAESNVGMPDKIYDYLAAGLPIVSSLKGELAMFLTEHRVGLMYEAGNAQSLAASVAKIADDPGLRREMATNSYANGAAFDRNCQFRQIVDLLEELSIPTRRSAEEASSQRSFWQG